MKLIKKSDLEYTAGYLTDARTGEVVDLSHLAREYNELMDVRELLEFVETHKTEILNAGQPVVFTPAASPEPAVIKSGRTVSTPAKDEAELKAKAIAEEWLLVQNVADIDRHLARYRNLAKWFDTEVVPHKSTDSLPTRFNGDIRDLTEADVVAIVARFHDPEIVKLREAVQINFS